MPPLSAVHSFPPSEHNVKVGHEAGARNKTKGNSVFAEASTTNSLSIIFQLFCTSYSWPLRSTPSSESDSSSTCCFFSFDSFFSASRSSWLKPCRKRKRSVRRVLKKPTTLETRIWMFYRKLLLLLISRLSENVCNHFPGRNTRVKGLRDILQQQLVIWCQLVSFVYN